MKILHIPETRTSPEIIFDCEKHILEIRGKSFPENAADFYAPVFSWIEEYLEFIHDQKVIINVELIYFNSSSSKAFMDLFDMLDAAADKGNQVILNWFYDEDNENALTAGEEFQEDLKFLTFNLIQKES